MPVDEREKRIKEVATQIRTHPDWKFSRRPESFETYLRRSMVALEDGRTVEYWFDHVVTKGVLRIELPAFCPYQVVAQGDLTQALCSHRASQSEIDPFHRELIDAYTTISRNYETSYTESVSDLAAHLRIEIPYQYSSRDIQAALTDMSKASVQIQRLHERLLNVLATPRTEETK